MVIHSLRDNSLSVVLFNFPDKKKITHSRHVMGMFFNWFFVLISFFCLILAKEK